jgi:hypothetical protein
VPRRHRLTQADARPAGATQKPSDYPEHDGVRYRFIKQKYEAKRFTTPPGILEGAWSVSSKEGFLLKQSRDDHSKWQKRWLVLSEGALAYYRQQDAESPAGSIRLNATAQIVPSGLDVSVCAGPGERAYLFRAATMDEALDWLTALRAARSVGGRGTLVRRAMGSSGGGPGSQPAAPTSPPMGASRAPPSSTPEQVLVLDAEEDEDEDPPGSKLLVKLARDVLESNPALVRQGWLFKRTGKLRVACALARWKLPPLHGD